MAVGPSIDPRAVSLNKPLSANIRAVAEAKGEAMSHAEVKDFDRVYRL